MAYNTTPSTPNHPINPTSSLHADKLREIDPEQDAPVLGWGPVAGQRLAALKGDATNLFRSVRRAAADALACMVQDAT